VFNGAGDGIEQVQCEQGANFTIIGFANELGHIGASVCKNGARVREMAMRTRDGLAATLKNLPPSSDEQARKAGLYYSQETLADGRNSSTSRSPDRSRRARTGHGRDL
jgi:hypothetical protein